MSISEKKNLNAIIYFASKSVQGKINRLKLMKLLWLADRIHLNKYGRLILKDTYCALTHGPVPSKTKDISLNSVDGMIDVKGFNIFSKTEFNKDYFSASDLDIMSYVWEKFGKLDRFELRDLSHKFPEWKRYEKDINDPLRPNSYNIIIDDFFGSPSNEDFKEYEYTSEEKEKSKLNFHTHSAIQLFLSK